MFGFAGTLLNQEKDKTGRHKGHGEDYTDRDQNVNWCGHPGEKKNRRSKRVNIHETYKPLLLIHV